MNACQVAGDWSRSVSAIDNRCWTCPSDNPMASPIVRAIADRSTNRRIGGSTCAVRASSSSRKPSIATVSAASARARARTASVRTRVAVEVAMYPT
ncbi:hypothetical protein [Aeromicrobium sp. UC242_57]|uniref:hypothetical protein n=1 Tax=Aeromicrobium sp. UC242_57 TaxID=3374624 RepID=UPI0037AA2EAC